MAPCSRARRRRRATTRPSSPRRPTARRSCGPASMASTACPVSEPRDAARAIFVAIFVHLICRTELLFLDVRSRCGAVVHPVRAVRGRVAEPIAPDRRGSSLLLHRPAPATVHGRVAGNPNVPRHRRARVRAQRPTRRVRVPVRRALPRRRRVPDPRRGQPGQAVPGRQPPPRRRRRLREAALRRARRPAHHVAPEPRRARVRVGQRRGRVGRRGVLRALGRGGGRRRVPRQGEDAQCQWTADRARTLHLLLLWPRHLPDALRFHEGKEKVLQGAGHLLRCVHPELRIHGNPRLPHVRRRRQLPSDAEPAGGKDQLEAGHLHDPDQPVPFSKYALMASPLAMAVEERLQPGGNTKRPVNRLVRTLLVASTVVFALAVPFFGYLMALVGSLLSVVASMLLPCIFYLKIFGATRGGKAEVAAIIVLGSLVAATGTYYSLKKIVHEF